MMKKILAFVLSFVMVISIVSVAPVFAETANSIKVQSNYSQGYNKITFVFVAPKGIEEIRGIQFKIEMPKDIEIVSIKKELPNNWVLREKIATTGRIMLNSSDYSTLEETASQSGEYKLLTFTIRATSSIPCQNQLGITVEDITSKNDASNLNSTGVKLNFSYHTFQKEGYDAEYHWDECECGTVNEESKVLHEFIGATCTKNGICDCGAEGGMLDHTYDIIINDIDYHWYECICGAISEETKAVHIFKGATCTKNGTCFCGAQGGMLDHTYGSYLSDKTYHWKECVCGDVAYKAEHNYKNAFCIDCGMRDPDAVVVETISEIPYFVNKNVVTVMHNIPCKVGYLGDDGKYVKIDAEIDDEGVYSFTAPADVTSVIVAVVGDVNGDGDFTNSDKTRLNAALQSKTTLTAGQQFAADVNNDNSMLNSDKTRINAVLQGKITFAW